ncbi:MAG: helix-turn-helix domain-containing protein [Clostridia bacterium]|nr:helix-turn-helix domain-containing protein [Clostridia bacterium]
MDNNKYKKCRVERLLNIDGFYTFSKQKFVKDYFFRGESHNFIEVVCVLEGRVGVTAGKNVYMLSGGQMTFHAPDEFHAIWAGEDSEPESVIFTFSASAFPKMRRPVYQLSVQMLSEIKELYQTAEKIFVFDGYTVVSVKPGMETASAAFVKRMEYFLLTVIADSDNDAPDAQRYCSENYTRVMSVMERNIDKALSVTELAELCGVSVPTLEKTVYKYLRCGAMTYYNVLRMKKASDMLSAGKSVKETAFSLGFANQNYFSASFKKHYGYPPSKLKDRTFFEKKVGKETSKESIHK